MFFLSFIVLNQLRLNDANGRQNCQHHPNHVQHAQKHAKLLRVFKSAEWYDDAGADDAEHQTRETEIQHGSPVQHQLSALRAKRPDGQAEPEPDEPEPEPDGPEPEPLRYLTLIFRAALTFDGVAFGR